MAIQPPISSNAGRFLQSKSNGQFGNLANTRAVRYHRPCVKHVTHVPKERIKPNDFVVRAVGGRHTKSGRTSPIWVIRKLLGLVVKTLQTARFR